MLFIIYDEKLRQEVLQTYLEEKEDIEKLYNKVIEWINGLYNRGSIIIPAIFASKIFLGDETWSVSMHTRAIAAIFQLIINVSKLPLWSFWGDMELGNETIRLIYIFSSASKVSGIGGRVIVCQFSDDDREVEVFLNNDKKIKITTLLGGISVIYTILKKYSKKNVDLDSLIKSIEEEYNSIVSESIAITLEEKIKEREKLAKKFKESGKEVEKFEIPSLEEELERVEDHEGV